MFYCCLCSLPVHKLVFPYDIRHIIIKGYLLVEKDAIEMQVRPFLWHLYIVPNDLPRTVWCFALSPEYLHGVIL